MAARDYNADIAHPDQVYGGLFFCNDSRCGKRFFPSERDYLAIYCKKISDARSLRIKARGQKSDAVECK